jgi:hypothetical protein
MTLHFYTLDYNDVNHQKWKSIQQSDGTYVLQNVVTSFVTDRDRHKIFLVFYK